MPLSPHELAAAKALRLLPERENLVDVFGNTQLFAEENAHLRARLLAIQGELLQLMSGISPN
jgi:hypothetical protein